MAERNEKAAARPRGRRKAFEPFYWARLEWRAWLSDPAIRLLTREQRARFMDVWCSTHATPTPGEMTEEEVRGFAGYEPREWPAQRDSFAKVFFITRGGKWTLPDVKQDFKASKRAYQSARSAGLKSAQSRKEAKELAKVAATEAATSAQLRFPTQDIDIEQEHRNSVPSSTATATATPAGPQIADILARGRSSARKAREANP